MAQKIIIAFASLAFLALYVDAYLIQRRPVNELSIKNFQYECPKSSRRVPPKKTSSPFQAVLDDLNYDETKQQFAVPPVSTRLFKILDMVVLPSREVCVLGEKLKNYLLPEDSQFEILLSIAAWCFPCMSDPIHTKRKHCFEQKLNSIGSDKNTKFQRFSKRLVAAIWIYYYFNLFLKLRQ